MTCRRWWRNWSVLLVLGVMPAALSLGAGPAAPGLHTADDFEKGDAKDLPVWREDILKAAAPKAATDKYSFASTICADFGAADKGVNSKRDDVRLNSAILIASIKTLSAENTLIKMLSSADPAVRYWAAKGLGDISGSLKTAGAIGASVRGLQGAGAKPEISGIVMQEILRSLAAFGDRPALISVLAAEGKQMAGNQPDVATLLSVAQGLESVAGTLASAPTAEKVDAANAAAQLASFAVQHTWVMDKQLKANDASASVPRDFQDAVQKVIVSATKVASAAAGKNYSNPLGGSPGELMLNVNALLGTPGGRAGNLQADLKGVSVPALISTGG